MPHCTESHRRPARRSAHARHAALSVLIAPAMALALAGAALAQNSDLPKPPPGAPGSDNPAPKPPTSPAAEKAAKEPGAKVLPSGLVYRPVKAGTGPSPKPTDVVRVHYRGTFPDGKEFDSSHKRGQPAEFPLNRVIPCWTEGVQLLKVGGSAKLTCVPEIAYGARGAGGVIPPNATLHFEVELLGIVGAK